MKLLTLQRITDGARIVRVAYEVGDLRPIYHLRPRKQDCRAEVGRVATLDEARALRGGRCPACRRRIAQVTFPLDEIRQVRPR